MSTIETSRAAVEITDPLALEQVVTELGGRRVLDWVDLPLRAGRITVLLGPSGVGKTVCVKHLTGLLPPSAGRVLIDGRDRGRLSAAELKAHRRELGVLFQSGAAQGGGLFGSMSVVENLRFVLRTQTAMAEDEIDARAREGLAAVGLTDAVERMPQDVSTGMARRAALARALVTEPRVLLLDDVDSGIDGIRLALLAEVLRAAQVESGATMLVTTHDPDLVRALADDVVVLRAGRVDAIGPAEEVLDRSRFRTAGFLAGDGREDLGMAPEPTPPATFRDADQSPLRTEGRALAPALLTLLIFVAIAVSYLAVAAMHKPG